MVIKYDPKLKIKNIAQLLPGTGARYLEVIDSPSRGEYIAKCWRRKAVAGKTLIDFKQGEWK